jgi:hypothetical protein
LSTVASVLGRCGEGGSGEIKENEPTSTVDEVDVGFKLRSHPQ